MGDRHDVCVVGAGLVGLSVARAIVEMLPGASVLVLDKEDRVAVHQSGHNSGVVHSGLYYQPGSLKARLCIEGRELLTAFCADAGSARTRAHSSNPHSRCRRPRRRRRCPASAGP